MKKIIYLAVSCVIFLLIKTPLYSNIENSIVAKVGNEIITSIDVENEVRTILFLSNKELNQKNFNQTQNLAINSIIKKLIKKSEIDKYDVRDYSENDLSNFKRRLYKQLNTNNEDSLKDIFLQNKISYEIFVDKYRTELIWNTMIFLIYKNQININIMEVENELKKRIGSIDNEKLSYKLSEIEISSKNNNLLNKVLEAIRDDGFSNTAKQFSSSATALDGGSIGWIEKDSLSKLYLKEIEKVKKGEITSPIEVQGLITILKIDGIKSEEKSKISLKELKEKIVAQKKEEKLNIFSNSHFAGLENTILIEYK